MKPIKNISSPTQYKGSRSGQIYTFESYVPCNQQQRGSIWCRGCRGRSRTSYILYGKRYLYDFCTHGIEAWRI